MDKNYNSEYYKKNREILLKRQKEKLMCPNCFKMVCRAGLLVHKKTNKCINFGIDKQTNVDINRIAEILKVDVIDVKALLDKKINLN